MRCNYCGKILRSSHFKAKGKKGSFCTEKCIISLQVSHSIKEKGSYLITTEDNVERIAWYNPTTGHWLDGTEGKEIGFGIDVLEKRIIKAEFIQQITTCVLRGTPRQRVGYDLGGNYET